MMVRGGGRKQSFGWEGGPEVGAALDVGEDDAERRGPRGGRVVSRPALPHRRNPNDQKESHSPCRCHSTPQGGGTTAVKKKTQKTQKNRK